MVPLEFIALESAIQIADIISVGIDALFALIKLKRVKESKTRGLEDYL
jgi:hypothetical protein